MKTRTVFVVAFLFVALSLIAGCTGDYKAQLAYNAKLKADEEKAAEKKAADEAAEATKKKERVVTLLEDELARFRYKLALSVWVQDKSYKEMDFEEKIFNLRRWIGSLVRYESEVIASEAKISELIKTYDGLWLQKRVRYLATFPKSAKEEKKIHKTVGFGKLDYEAKIVELGEQIESLREDAVVAQLKATNDKKLADAKRLADAEQERKFAEDEAKKLADEKIAEAKKLPEYSPQEIAELKKMHGTAKMYFIVLSRAKIDIDTKIEHLEKKYETVRKVSNATKKKLGDDLETAKEKKGNQKEIDSLEKELKAVDAELAKLDRDEERAVAVENEKLAHNTIQISRANRHAKLLRDQLK
ncbi:MAG: hypothetical protein EXS48_01355 [Candidatus Staskawiczbacteria bacterium]|nr:hypothetical protein [Candidatus Staskawiczbacteria bacterium]